jgi:hypothetical protein
MPRRHRNVFAWWRLVMGPHGPQPITRLVLSAHVLFMDRDGGNCFVGVRRLAETTGLNKSTVAEHRETAIKLGWLMTSADSRYSRKRTVLSAVPDSIPIDDKELSGRAGQSRAGRECDLSNLGAFAVQFGRINCPAGPDKPLLPPLPLKTSHQDSNAGKTPSFSIETRQARIRAWLTTDALALRYAADVDALERLIPPAWRFAGYGHFIAREIRALVAVADCPEGKPPGIAG